MFARKSPTIEPNNFFENCSREPLGPQVSSTFYAKSIPRDSFRMKICKNQKLGKIAVFLQNFQFFEIFSRIYCTTLIGQNFL